MFSAEGRRRGIRRKGQRWWLRLHPHPRFSQVDQRPSSDPTAPIAPSKAAVSMAKIRIELRRGRRRRLAGAVGASPRTLRLRGGLRWSGVYANARREVRQARSKRVFDAHHAWMVAHWMKIPDGSVTATALGNNLERCAAYAAPTGSNSISIFGVGPHR
jgi:hypothetical protein